uniref:Cytoplasmic dynein 2 heavy chain 1 n=1 Tax=Meloidogyne incognita TaxID=6306 RepID=A0A914LNP4_MELIC
MLGPHIELGVRFGKTLIVDELDNDIEPSLVPLLRREFKSIGTRLTVQLGEKQVDFNDKFRLFLCTRNENNRLGEHIRGSLTEVNFSVTRSGLASQLLGLAIQIEQPELERNSAQLSSQMESLQVQLDQIEQVLLEELAKSEGSLLENNSLLESLNQSKEKAEKVAKGIVESKRLRAEIDSKREAFRPFAERCAQLYFAIRPLNSIKSCYQYSVNDCIALFRKCFDSNNVNDARPKSTTGPEEGGKSHLERIYRRLRQKLFEYISLSLFKEDRLTFAMQYLHQEAVSVGGGQHLFAPKEWELFTGVLQLPSENVGENNSQLSQIGWLSDYRDKKQAIELIRTHLPSLFQQMQINDQQAWAGFMKSTECENAYPPSINSRLSDFQRVLIIQALRPDRLHAGINRFASKVLGIESLSSQHLDLLAIHKEEPSSRPILLLVSPGSSVDPSAELIECAKQQQRKFHQMAFGQPGTETIVLQMLRQCFKDGDWICLNNAHLSTPSLLGKLLVEISSTIVQSNPSKGEFRLWLTAEPEEQLPGVFLQTCVKITYETPPGIKQNLEQNYFGPEMEIAPKSLSHLKANFLLHWLHAVIQERRNFIPQAWLRFYEFSGADLRVAKNSLDTLFAKNTSNSDPLIYWERFRGLMSNALYGGRIEAELDNRILSAFLLDLFNPSIIEGKDGNVELANGLKMPNFGRHSEYIHWVETTLPVVDRAELLYLPRNIMLSWDLTQSTNVISKLRLLFTSKETFQRLQTTSSGGPAAIASRQQLADALNPLLGLWKRLNQQNPGLLHAAAEQKNQRPISAGQELKETSPSFGRRTGDDPLAEILHLELVFALKLMQFIHTSLSALSRAIKGTQLPEKRIVEMAKELMHFQVPSAWDALWSGPPVPSQYLEILISKAKSTQLMLSSARSNQLLGSRVNLAHLLRPGTLLNAFRQYSARKLNVSMDELILSTIWQNDQNNISQPNDIPTLTLSNLRVQGGIFDGKELKSVTANTPSFTEAPALKIFWRKEEIGEQTQFKDKQQLLLPVFSDLDRREMIFQVSVTCPISLQSSWILAGVAFFLSQN